jgi:hypothetical protein
MVPGCQRWEEGECTHSRTHVRHVAVHPHRGACPDVGIFVIYQAEQCPQNLAFGAASEHAPGGFLGFLALSTTGSTPRLAAGSERA